MEPGVDDGGHCPHHLSLLHLRLRALPAGRPTDSSPAAPASERHPVSGRGSCARAGWHAHEAPTWGERLTRPLVRRDGEQVEASWGGARRGRPTGSVRGSRGRGSASACSGRGARPTRRTTSRSGWRAAHSGPATSTSACGRGTDRCVDGYRRGHGRSGGRGAGCSTSSGARSSCSSRATSPRRTRRWPARWCAARRAGRQAGDGELAPHADDSAGDGVICASTPGPRRARRPRSSSPRCWRRAGGRCGCRGRRSRRLDALRAGLAGLAVSEAVREVASWYALGGPRRHRRRRGRAAAGRGA